MLYEWLLPSDSAAECQGSMAGNIGRNWFYPFQTDVTSILTQLSVEQDFLTGGDDNIFGETKESCLAAIDKVLERIENPLAAVTEERAAYLQQEKEFLYRTGI